MPDTVPQPESQHRVRIAAMGDMHIGRSASPGVAQAFARVREAADVLVLCGDLTDRGTEDEAQQLSRDLKSVGLPIVAVLGNHDFEAGLSQQVARILSDGGVYMLDGEAIEVLGVGFAGIKGFGGGFGRGALGPWGEPVIKAFVQEAVDEALKLETALARLRTPRKVAVLHYSPVRGTVEDEPPEIFPYLGSSRLEEPLNRYPVDVVLHGHAHGGRFEARTSGGVPVYNVAAPLLLRRDPAAPPFHIVELAWTDPAATP
ncbi:metallophosphoesterase family protein [Luteitalea pratensis]|nr:metallophosphoesterase [Luteitalea pratensis]